jgi:hypothetical protein
MLTQYRSYSGDAIEVHVEGTKFLIPKSVICRTSDFFKNAAKPEWEGEHGPRPIVLDEDTLKVFQLYTVWLYNGSIERADSSMKTWDPLSQAYIMGERFMDTAFQATILAAMIHRLNAGRKPDIHTVNDIYGGTSDPSPARRLMIDIILWMNRDCLRHVENPADELHEDLVRDLLKALLAVPVSLKSGAPWTADPSKYFKLFDRG